MKFTSEQLTVETERLLSYVDHLGWTKEDCAIYAPLTLEINKIKKEKNAVVLSHSYQLPEIIYGIADFVGDSYGLSKQAMQVEQETILFCGVVFMAETAKILNPEKTVIIPSPDAGCSLSESITGKDVKKLRVQYPQAAIACYVNTSAEVKAECDVCFTSANALKVINALPQQKVICLPDKLMAKNLADMTDKTIIGWDGTCIVHERFSAETIKEVRNYYPDVKILVHTECNSDVVKAADVAGGTTDMVDAVKEAKTGSTFMIVTECGLADRMRVEYPDKQFVGTCHLCHFMKKNTLKNVLQALKNPREDQIIILDEAVRLRAKQALDTMFTYTS
jgi:quinolinate synthase